jgi:hypothetical protein
MPFDGAAVDWPRLAALVEAERVGPAVAFACKREPPAALPGSLLARARRDLADSTARHLRLSGELAGLLRAFGRERLPLIPLKGPVLAETIYPHPAVRPYTDLDILVRRADFERVDGVLQRLGCRAVAEPHAFRFDAPYDGASLYEGPSGTFIDVHCSLLSEAGYGWNEAAAESVWRRAVSIRVAGEPGIGLCREDLLLYLAMHVSVHHGGAGLLWLYDLFLLVHRYGATLDWRALEGRAAQWRVRTAVQLALGEAAVLFGAGVPTPVLTALRRRGPRALALRWLLRRRPRYSAAIFDALVPVLLVDRARDVTGPLTRALLPPRTWLRARYPSAGRDSARYFAHYRRLARVARRATGW